MAVLSCAGTPSRLPASPAPFTEAERAGLEVTPAGIRHAVFGFSAPHPGEGFTIDTGAAAQAVDSVVGAAAPQLMIQNWLFDQPGGPGVAALQLHSVPSTGEGFFRGFASGMKKGVRAPTGGDILADTVIWTAERKEIRMTVRHKPSDMFAIWRCLPSMPSHARRYIICAMSAATDTTGLAVFTNGLSVTTPR